MNDEATSWDGLLDETAEYEGAFVQVIVDLVQANGPDGERADIRVRVSEVAAPALFDSVTLDDGRVWRVLDWRLEGTAWVLACVPGASVHTVTVQSPSESRDTGGSATVTWATAVSCLAFWRVQSAQEQQQAGRQVEQQTVEFALPYSALVTPQCRIVYGSRMWQIDGVVDPSGSGRRLLVQAVETQD